MAGHEVQSILHALIETSKGGEYGFADAARHAYAPQFRTLLRQYSVECGINATELEICVGMVGGAVTRDDASTPLPELLPWAAFKASQSPDDDLMLLEQCERREDQTRRLYDHALKLLVSPEVRYLLLQQSEKARHLQQRIRDLRERGMKTAA